MTCDWLPALVGVALLWWALAVLVVWLWHAPLKRERAAHVAAQAGAHCPGCRCATGVAADAVIVDVPPETPPETPLVLKRKRASPQKPAVLS